MLEKVCSSTVLLLVIFYRNADYQKGSSPPISFIYNTIAHLLQPNVTELETTQTGLEFDMI